MLKMIVTDAVVSKGFDNNPAIRFYNGENGFQSATFRIGKRVYDSKAEKNHRWINLTVKGFGEVCERIKKMKLKEGSFINLIARYDEETWDDNSGEKRTAPVLYLDEIEYCSSGGNGQKNGQNSASGSGTPAAGASGTGPAPSAPQGQPYPPIPQGMPYPGAPQGAPYGQPPQAGAAQQTPPSMPGNFTGFENFGGQQDQYF